MTQTLLGRVALVTGAAGEGIGQAVARRLARDGAAVVITDSHARRTAEVAAKLAVEHGDRILGLPLDVADRARVVEVIAETERRLGPIDILVNNAAENVLGPVSRYRLEDWDRVIEVDLGACFHLIRRVLPRMIERRRGSIVNVTSVAAFIGNEREGPYAAAKAALHSLTRSVAVEGGPHGVRCNAVAPGIIESRFVTRHADALLPEVARTPLRRLGGADEVANVVAFLVSEESSFVTGEIINVSGGWYMRP